MYEVKEEINRVKKELKNLGTTIEKPEWVEKSDYNTPNDRDIKFIVGGKTYGYFTIKADSTKIITK